MKGTQTLACRTILAVASVLAASRAWGDGEVTVVGVSWQQAQASKTDREVGQAVAQSAAPSPPSQTTPMPLPPQDQAPGSQGPCLEDDGSEFHEELRDFEGWLDQDGWNCWTIDYRYRGLVSSGITSTFGTSAPPPVGYAPLTQFNFPINSSWHGLRLAVDKPNWGAHFEWMTPQKSIDGQMSDYDWNFTSPPQPGQEFTDLGFAQERWVDGEMIDLGLDFRLAQRTFTLPIEIWPMIGFRWQRFDLTCYNGVQVKSDNQWLNPPDQYPGDVMTFNQQFYIGYLGGQFRMKLGSVALAFQADWGYTWGYNVDHYLLRQGDLYTMEATDGSSWHLGFTAEVPVTSHLSFGFQCDHLEIRTTGTHQLQNLPLGEDVTWSNGVSVSSNQTSLVAFVRFRL